MILMVCFFEDRPLVGNSLYMSRVLEGKSKCYIVMFRCFFHGHGW